MIDIKPVFKPHRHVALSIWSSKGVLLYGIGYMVNWKPFILNLFADGRDRSWAVMRARGKWVRAL